MKAAQLAALGIAAGGLAWYMANQQAQASTAGQGGIDWAGIGQSVADSAAVTTNKILGALGMRGIRNNNPGNIRHSATVWQGQSAQQTDSAFVQFDTPEAGIRALSVLLNTYATKYALNTVSAIIGRFAPESENNTGAYINAVANEIGVLPNQPISVQARKTELVQAIIRHENGAQPYDLAVIQTGVNLA